MAVYPPSYGVMIGDSIRETEASRLKTRGSIKTRLSELQQLSSSDDQQQNWQGNQLTCVFDFTMQQSVFKQVKGLIAWTHTLCIHFSVA